MCKNLEHLINMTSRDDRKLLIEASSKPSELSQLLSPHCHFYIEQHIRQNGDSYSQANIESTLNEFKSEFFHWINENRILDEIKKSWSFNKLKSYSLPLALSRYFYRFCIEFEDKEDWCDITKSGQIMWLEVPNPVRNISKPLLNAFSAMTQNISKENRLTYQLHIEGLIDSEIAFILQKTPQEIRQTIMASKKELSMPEVKETGS